MKFLVTMNHSYMLLRFRRELLEELTRRGEVVVSVPYDDEKSVRTIREIGCRTIRTPIDRRGTNPLTDSKLLAEYVRMLKREKPDVVLTISIKPNVYMGIACSTLGIRRIAVVQGMGSAFEGGFKTAIVSKMLKFSFRGAEKVFFENGSDAREFVRRGIVFPKKVQVVAGAGVNPERFPVEKYPDETDGTRFLYLGRIMREKGVGELVRAFDSIRKYDDRATLDVVGFFEDGYERKFEALTKQYGDGIYLHDFTRNPNKFYRTASCVVVPSWHEGMNNVLLEAASTGRPTITTNVPGCRETVLDGKTGFLCEARNPDSLAEAMRKFLGLPHDKRSGMGMKASEFVRRSFDRNDVVRTYAEALER